MHSAEEILLPFQRLQLTHDELAHRDILSFSLHTRLKHMALHFYKYAGRIETARPTGDMVELRRTLIDAFIICMASANALNVSLGASMPAAAEANTLDSLANVVGRRFIGHDLFADAVSQLVIIGGRMAKSLESQDHMEDGNPRAEMIFLVPQMAEAMLGLLSHVCADIEKSVRGRLTAVEMKSIFAGTPAK